MYARMGYLLGQHVRMVICILCETKGEKVGGTVATSVIFWRSAHSAEHHTDLMTVGAVSGSSSCPHFQNT